MSVKWSVWVLIFVMEQTIGADTDYNIINNDGSYDFRYDNPDSYHESHASRDNVVTGVFAGKNPATGNTDRTEYTAGPRGFRPKGPNVARKYDFSQREVRPIGNKDDPYFDPYEDPSYNFQFNTRDYSRKEGANRFGDVKGSYTFLDDVGDKHEVEYIAGKNTGFHVKTPYPDSYPNSYRTLYFRDPRKPYMRGRSFVQRGIDGSYRFAAVGPDQRRTEVSDSVGNVRGSYTYKDEKGVQHSVHYIAGPNIGYRVLKNVKGPHLPTIFPFNSQDIVPSDFYENKESESDVFAQAASTYVTPKPSKDDDKYSPGISNQIDKTTKRPKPSDSATIRPTKPPISDFGGDGGEDEEELFDDLFNSGVKPAPGRPGAMRPSTYRPPTYTTKPRGKPGQLPTTYRPQISGGKPGDTSQSGKPPTSGGDDSDSFDDSDDNIFGAKPSGSSGGAFGARPSPSNGNIFGTKPSGSSSSIFGTKPSASNGNVFGSRPSTSSSNVFGTKPSFPSDEDIFNTGASGSASGGNNFGSTTSGIYGTRPSLTGGPFSQRPRPPSQSVTGKPLLQFDLAGPADDDDRYHTIITNYGDTVFTAPPGVPVRAHVQSIGLLPLYPRSPSPSEQYNEEMDGNSEKEDVQAAANNHIKVSTTRSTAITTILTAPTIPISTTQSVETTTSSAGTTTAFPLPETTTTS